MRKTFWAFVGVSVYVECLDVEFNVDTISQMLRMILSNIETGNGRSIRLNRWGIPPQRSTTYTRSNEAMLIYE